MTWFAHQNCMSEKNCKVIAIKRSDFQQEQSQDLELGGQFYCQLHVVSSVFSSTAQPAKVFFYYYFFLCVCRACLLLVRTKLFCLKFFKWLSCLFLLKLVDQSQICFLALLSPLGNFSCWANILGLYFFFQILDL